ncbi:MAG: hypothetical protein H7Z72_07325 [Bacteroidetes bacterium]|nr:hypothetical protein [Fibrella sp.]
MTATGKWTWSIGGWLFVNCLTGLAQATEPAFQQRARYLVRQTATQYRPPAPTIGDPEKYYWPYIMARFEHYGVQDSVGNYWIARFRDNSPFHFTLVGMARLLGQYPLAPAIARYKTGLLQRVFERTDSYNPWTGEGTENHIGMSRSSGYLVAQYALKQPGAFPDSPQRLNQMRDWIEKTARQLYRTGSAEWNSSTYEAYNILGWLNLYDFADDAHIRTVARAVLDYYAAELALHYSYGSIGGAEMRGSGVGQGLYSATHYLAWLWFGGNTPADIPVFVGNEYIQSLHAVTSSYRPPALAVELAHKQHRVPAEYRGSKPSYGLEVGSFAKEMFYTCPHFTLGTSLDQYGGWTGSTYQIVNWKLVIRPDPDALPGEVSGNGRFYENWTGKTRDPFTQWVQHQQVLVQMTRVPLNADSLWADVSSRVNQWATDWARDFQQRFPTDTGKANVVRLGDQPIRQSESYLTLPASAHIEQTASGCFVQIDSVYLAVYNLSRTGPITQKTLPKNRVALISQAPAGAMCGFVMEVADATEFPKLAAFQQAMRGKEPSLQGSQVRYRTHTGDLLEATYTINGSSIEATVDWGYGVTQPQARLTYPAFHQPNWSTGPGFGRMPVWSVNGRPVRTDVDWPVYEGPGLRVADQVLTLTLNRRAYRVDYRKKEPVFEMNQQTP